MDPMRPIAMIYLAPSNAAFWRRIPRSMSRYPAAGSVESAKRKAHQRRENPVIKSVQTYDQQTLPQSGVCHGLLQTFREEGPGLAYLIRRGESRDV